MLSYHNDPKIKQKYIDRFQAHRAADEVIQGTGFEDGRGCFVGCTLDAYDHSRFPEELGWPEWLAHLADGIFEGIPKAEAPQFGTDLLEAVGVGVDLEPVKHKLAVRRMTRLISEQTDLSIGHPDLAGTFQEVIAALEQTKALHEQALSGSEAANAAAWARAAESATAAANAAAWARAAWAAWAARAAAWSAESAPWARAAESARAAANAAAWAAESAAAWKIERDDLLDILRNMRSSA